MSLVAFYLSLFFRLFWIKYSWLDWRFVFLLGIVYFCWLRFHVASAILPFAPILASFPSLFKRQLRRFVLHSPIFIHCQKIVWISYLGIHVKFGIRLNHLSARNLLKIGKNERDAIDEFISSLFKRQLWHLISHL